MKLYSLALLFLISVSAVAQEHDHAAKKVPNPAWDKMRTLVGTWNVKDGAPGATVTYELVSGGTALMETVRYAKGHEMITMYSPDGSDVAMIHYCEAGNQPRMRAKGVEGEEIRFEFVDIGNLPSPETEYMRTLRMRFTDADHVQALWTSHAPGKDSPFAFDLTRAKS